MRLSLCGNFATSIAEWDLHPGGLLMVVLLRAEGADNAEIS
jgi:hypothetical protein